MQRKILFHVYALAGGGAERVIATLASGLAARGHDVTLATDFAAPEAAALVGPNVRQIDLGHAHGRAVLRLAGLLRRERPDVSISATGVSNLKHAAASLLAGRARRAILSFHGHIESEPGTLSQLGNRLAPALTRLTGRSVFVSDELLGAFRRAGADKRRSLRIYNPVPVAASPSFEPAGKRTILGVGRLVPLKGFDTLIRAFARLDPTMHLTIIGEGPERGRLEAAIQTLGLDGRVDLPGWVEHPEGFYAAAACFVCASHRESFGNVVVEALAHGLPVVATDCGGPREILQDGRLGRLVPVGDDVAMARAVSACLAEPGEPSPRRARAAEFAPDAALDAYERLIETVIAEGGHAQP